ncbi:MAG: hypothetical protein ACPGEG_10015 [Salibacteraceae bacterium]
MKRLLVFCFSVLMLTINTLSQVSTSVVIITENPHEDVRIEFEQLRDQGLKHGYYHFYHRNKLIVKGKYLGGKKHGKWFRYYQNGNPMISAFYIQDKKHGKWEYYFDDKRPKAEITFNRGNKIGVWMSWYYDGFIKSTIEHATDSTLEKHSLYYSTENLLPGSAQPQLHFSVELANEGETEIQHHTKYYRNGKLHEKYTLKDGEYYGMYESYYFTGLPWRKMKYEYGERLQAIYKYQNPVGRDANRGNFREGNGTLLTYNSNGNLFSKVDYKNGLRDGKAVIYENGDKELIQGYFNDNNMTGTWRSYKPVTTKEELVAEFNYTGIDTLYAQFFTSDQQARQEGLIHNWKKWEVWETYNAAGDLIQKSNFKSDFNHGKETGYRSGNISRSGHYFFGIKIGDWKFYNDNLKVTYSEKYKTNLEVDDDYLMSDSCLYGHFKEMVYYESESHVRIEDKQWVNATIIDFNINFNSPLLNGQFSTLGKKTEEEKPEVEEYFETLKPEFPKFVPRELDVRHKVVKDIDEGLFVETIDPKRLKVKGDKFSPKVGVALVVLYIDEFGCIGNKKLVRGVSDKYDAEILKLFESYNFWEPATLNNLPMSVAFQLKIPLEEKLVKSLD